MTQYVPIIATPSQTMTVNLGGQQCTIQIDQKYTGGVFLTLTANGKPIVTSRMCRDRVGLVRSAYLPFFGNLAFVDTQGATDPDWRAFGTRYKLAYIP